MNVMLDADGIEARSVADPAADRPVMARSTDCQTDENSRPERVGRRLASTVVCRFR